jgi:hypothetical protein
LPGRCDQRLSSADLLLVPVIFKRKIGAVEFYTTDGFHPVHTKRRLKPMTELILNKYARGNAVLRAGNN